MGTTRHLVLDGARYTKRGNLCPVPRATFGEYLQSRCSRGKEYSHPKFCVVGWLHGIDKEGNDGNEMFPCVSTVTILYTK